MLKRFGTLTIIFLVSFAAAGAWAEGGRITGALLDEIDLCEDESCTQCTTVEAAKLQFPIEIQEASSKAFKIPFQGRSYWVIRGLVKSEGVGTTVRRESVNDDAVGATRGLGSRGAQ
jgi:hypothetical protein